MAGGSRKGAWSARRSDKEPWIQINLGKIVEVTKVGSQGRQEAAQWVTKYKVSYSTDGHHFTSQNQVKRQVQCHAIAAMVAMSRK